MEEEYEEEAYGGDIPGEVELLGHHDDEYEEEVELGDEEEGEEAATDADNTQAGGPVNTAAKELEEMKKRLKEMETEAAALRDMQAKAEKEMSTVQDSASTAGTKLNREETDARSIFVGNVDYSCTPEEVQEHFQSCGTVNRVTILIDGFGQPKGYAYVEFLEVEAVQNAILLSETELHNRPLKVTAKRTNLPGMKASRGGRFSPYSGYRPRRPYQPPYGKVPRGRRPMRYRPYY